MLPIMALSNNARTTAGFTNDVQAVVWQQSEAYITNSMVIPDTSGHCSCLVSCTAIVSTASLQKGANTRRCRGALAFSRLGCLLHLTSNLLGICRLDCIPALCKHDGSNQKQCSHCFLCHACLVNNALHCMQGRGRSCGGLGVAADMQACDAESRAHCMIVPSVLDLQVLQPGEAACRGRLMSKTAKQRGTS